VRFSFAVWMAVFLFGCASQQAVLQIATPQARAASAPVRIFKLQSLSDARVFEARPRQASVPSIEGGKTSDKQLASRAIGRRRGPLGKAKANILVGVNQTVEQLIHDTLGAALARAGAVLVEPSDSRYAQAEPMDVRITQLWGWVRPGAVKVAIEFNLSITLKANLSGFEAGRVVSAQQTVSGAVLGESDWKAVLDAGLLTLADNLARELSPVVAQ